MKRVLLLIPLFLLVVGCNDWERTTFQTLATSKAVLDSAQNDYEAQTIPKNECAFSLINDGKAAQTVAVNAMVEYEQIKAQKGNTSSQEALVVADIAALGPLVVKVQSLISNPASCGVSK